MNAVLDSGDEGIEWGEAVGYGCGEEAAPVRRNFCSSVETYGQNCSNCFVAQDEEGDEVDADVQC